MARGAGAVQFEWRRDFITIFGTFLYNDGLFQMNTDSVLYFIRVKM